MTIDGDDRSELWRSDKGCVFAVCGRKKPKTVEVEMGDFATDVARQHPVPFDCTNRRLSLFRPPASAFPLSTGAYRGGAKKEEGERGICFLSFPFFGPSLK